MEQDLWEQDPAPVGVWVRVDLVCAAEQAATAVGASVVEAGAGAAMAAGAVGAVVSAPGGMALSAMAGPQHMGPPLMRLRPSEMKRLS